VERSTYGALIARIDRQIRELTEAKVSVPPPPLSYERLSTHKMIQATRTFSSMSGCCA
jgi:hypothetical protein